MSRTTFVQISTLNHGDCFMETVLRENGSEGFRLMITDGEKVWSGDLTEDNIDTLSTKAKMNFDDFVTQTANAFTQESSCSSYFEFDLKVTDDNTVSLIWKKYVPSDDIRFQLGSVQLYEKDDPAKNIKKILQKCITRTESLQDRITSLTTDNDRLSSERTKVLKRLDKCVTAREDLEKELYEKFVAVLNSKKEKIRELKQQISEGIDTVDSSAPKPGTSKDSDEEDAIKNVASVTNQIRVDEKEDTDDESPAKKRRRGPAARASKKDTDSSLILDDEEETTAVARRPARQRGAKKQTPSKPVLPKVMSKRSDSGSGEGRRSSMRKSSSHSSNRSSDYNDPDALLDDLE